MPEPTSLEMGILSKLDCLNAGMTEVKVEVAKISTRIESQLDVNANMRKCVDDHEERLNSHDKTINRIIGALILISGTIPLIIFVTDKVIL